MQKLNDKIKIFYLGFDIKRIWLCTEQINTFKLKRIRLVILSNKSLAGT